MEVKKWEREVRDLKGSEDVTCGRRKTRGVMRECGGLHERGVIREVYLVGYGVVVLLNEVCVFWLVENIF